MYAGRMVEIGPVRSVIHSPSHPHTAGLMRSMPRVGRTGSRLTQIDGVMPRLDAIPSGCAFHPRCTQRFDPYDRECPPLFETADRFAAGKVANPLDPPPGCTFHRRNPLANQRCRTERPELKVELHGGALVACHAVEEGRIAA